MSTHRFKFTHERYACNVPTSHGNVVVDVSNGFYSTEDEEVAKFLTEKSNRPSPIVISLDKVQEIIAESQPKQRGRPKTVGGTRSSKESEGETVQ